MGMFAVKNDKGEWLYSDEYNDWIDQLSQATFYDTFEDADDDIECWELSNAYVVELAEAPAKIVVSEDEAKMLEQAKCDDDPAELIVGFVNSRDNYDDDRKAEDRLMRAYVNGWTAEKPKRYFVRVPHANRHYYYQKCDSGEVIPVWDMETEPPTQFTVAEIEHYELTDCERVEVTDDEV